MANIVTDYLAAFDRVVLYLLEAFPSDSSLTFLVIPFPFVSQIEFASKNFFSGTFFLVGTSSLGDAICCGFNSPRCQLLHLYPLPDMSSDLGLNLQPPADNTTQSNRPNARLFPSCYVPNSWHHCPSSVGKPPWCSLQGSPFFLSL